MNHFKKNVSMALLLSVGGLCVGAGNVANAVPCPVGLSVEEIRTLHGGGQLQGWSVKPDTRRGLDEMFKLGRAAERTRDSAQACDYTVPPPTSSIALTRGGPHVVRPLPNPSLSNPPPVVSAPSVSTSSSSSSSSAPEPQRPGGLRDPMKPKTSKSVQFGDTPRVNIHPIPGRTTEAYALEQGVSSEEMRSHLEKKRKEAEKRAQEKEQIQQHYGSSKPYTAPEGTNDFEQEWDE